MIGMSRRTASAETGDIIGSNHGTNTEDSEDIEQVAADHVANRDITLTVHSRDERCDELRQ